MNTRIALTIGIPAPQRNLEPPCNPPETTPVPPSTDVNQHYTLDINDALVACYVPGGYVVYDMHGRTRKT